MGTFSQLGNDMKAGPNSITLYAENTRRASLKGWRFLGANIRVINKILHGWKWFGARRAAIRIAEEMRHRGMKDQRLTNFVRTPGINAVLKQDAEKLIELGIHNIVVNGSGSTIKLDCGGLEAQDITEAERDKGDAIICDQYLTPGLIGRGRPRLGTIIENLPNGDRAPRVVHLDQTFSTKPEDGYTSVSTHVGGSGLCETTEKYDFSVFDLVDPINGHLNIAGEDCRMASFFDRIDRGNRLEVIERLTQMLEDTQLYDELCRSDCSLDSLISEDTRQEANKIAHLSGPDFLSLNPEEQNSVKRLNRHLLENLLVEDIWPAGASYFAARRIYPQVLTPTEKRIGQYLGGPVVSAGRNAGNFVRWDGEVDSVIAACPRSASVFLEQDYPDIIRKDERRPSGPHGRAASAMGRVQVGLRTADQLVDDNGYYLRGNLAARFRPHYTFHFGKSGQVIIPFHKVYVGNRTLEEVTAVEEPDVAAIRRNLKAGTRTNISDRETEIRTGVVTEQREEIEQAARAAIKPKLLRQIERTALKEAMAELGQAASDDAIKVRTKEKVLKQLSSQIEEETEQRVKAAKEQAFQTELADRTNTNFEEATKAAEEKRRQLLPCTLLTQDVPIIETNRKQEKTGKKEKKKEFIINDDETYVVTDRITGKIKYIISGAAQIRAWQKIASSFGVKLAHGVLASELIDYINNQADPQTREQCKVFVKVMRQPDVDEQGAQWCVKKVVPGAFGAQKSFLHRLSSELERICQKHQHTRGGNQISRQLRQSGNNYVLAKIIYLALMTSDQGEVNTGLAAKLAAALGLDEVFPTSFVEDLYASVRHEMFQEDKMYAIDLGEGTEVLDLGDHKVGGTMRRGLNVKEAMERKAIKYDSSILRRDLDQWLLYRRILGVPTTKAASISNSYLGFWHWYSSLTWTGCTWRRWVIQDALVDRSFIPKGKSAGFIVGTNLTCAGGDYIFSDGVIIAINSQATLAAPALDDKLTGSNRYYLYNWFGGGDMALTRGYVYAKHTNLTLFPGSGTTFKDHGFIDTAIPLETETAPDGTPRYAYPAQVNLFNQYSEVELKQEEKYGSEEVLRALDVNATAIQTQRHLRRLLAVDLPNARGTGTRSSLGQYFPYVGEQQRASWWVSLRRRLSSLGRRG